MKLTKEQELTREYTVILKASNGIDEILAIKTEQHEYENWKKENLYQNE